MVHEEFCRHGQNAVRTHADLQLPLSPGLVERNGADKQRLDMVCGDGFRQLLWSARLSSDPEIGWLRGLLRAAITDTFGASDMLTARQISHSRNSKG